ncbi:MAG: hypothetical protein CMM52_12375 [Rhodospirillaceae bacterium]|nr:hypothetical protein [Rhodospirillaceae bacterium]|tara:strand:+ start:19386 stop:20009 length:624 start_codon:yes stop_codon:yes gene_type:complete
MGVICVAGTILSACTGGLGGGPVATQVVTEPSGATCDLTGNKFAIRAQTPLKTQLPKSAGEINLSCVAVGYRTFNTVLKPTFNDRVLRNFLVGSSMGMAVDLMNGNHEQYPRRVVLHLEPHSFASAAERDRWYSRYKQYIEFKWRRVLDEIRSNCSESSGEDGNCQTDLIKAQDARQNELQQLEQRRLRAFLKPDYFRQVTNLTGSN